VRNAHDRRRVLGAGANSVAPWSRRAAVAGRVAGGRAVVAVMLALLACALATPARAAPSLGTPGDVDGADSADVGGCAPDPDTGETYCGDLDAEAPEATALRSASPLATTLTGVRAGSPPALEQAAASVGLSDQNDPRFVDPWRDARLTAPAGLGLHEGRLVVPWNVYARAKAADPDTPASTATRAGRDLDRWRRVLQEMKRGGFDDPVVSFERQHDLARAGRVAPQPLPHPAEYIAAVTGFVAYIGRLEDAEPSDDAYPRLRRFTAWNEPNNRTQPTATDARRAGQYFRALAAWCAGRCSVAAGDFVEQSATAADADAFTRYLHDYCDGMDGEPDGRCGYRPLLWAFHPYGCGFRRDTSGVRAFVRSTAAREDGVPSPADPDIWFTEAGGVVTRHYNADPDGRVVSRRTLVDRAARDLAFILHDCVAASPRITRVYVYHWAGDQKVDPSTRRDRGFDAGLTDIAKPIPGDPSARYALTPLYCTLKAAVKPGACRATP
jgi:hypothetical protein